MIKVRLVTVCAWMESEVLRRKRQVKIDFIFEILVYKINPFQWHLPEYKCETTKSTKKCHKGHKENEIDKWEQFFGPGLQAGDLDGPVFMPTSFNILSIC